MTCEKCWNDAWVRAVTFGGSRLGHYRDLLAERFDDPCPESLCNCQVCTEDRMEAAENG